MQDELNDNHLHNKSRVNSITYYETYNKPNSLRFLNVFVLAKSTVDGGRVDLLYNVPKRKDNRGDRKTEKK